MDELVERTFRLPTPAELITLRRPLESFGKKPALRFREGASMLYGAGWKDALVLMEQLATALGESLLYPEAVGGPNADGSYDFGWLQLNSVHAESLGLSIDQFKAKAFDPAWATNFARGLYREQLRRGKSPLEAISAIWYAHANGTYKTHLKAAGLGVGNMLAAREFNPGKQTYTYL